MIVIKIGKREIDQQLETWSRHYFQAINLLLFNTAAVVSSCFDAHSTFNSYFVLPFLGKFCEKIVPFQQWCFEWIFCNLMQYYLRILAYISLMDGNVMMVHQMLPRTHCSCCIILRKYVKTKGLEHPKDDKAPAWKIQNPSDMRKISAWH